MGKKKKQEDNRGLWKVIFLLSSLGFIFCLSIAGWYGWQVYQTEQTYKRIQQETNTESASLTGDEGSSASTTEFDGQREGEAARLPEDIFLDMENPVNFEKLAEINPELYAWIRVPDTNIDYPVAQKQVVGEDDYYLDHDLYGDWRFAGCIYSEACNSLDFTDPNTVLYGHNMKNGSMFQNLHKFEDQEFFDKHEYFYIYTAEKVLVYKVFAAYTSDDSHIMGSYHFEDKEVFRQYLDDILKGRSMDAHIREGITLTDQDRILTLSTCSAGAPKHRYIVQGVLYEGS